MHAVQVCSRTFFGLQSSDVVTAINQIAAAFDCKAMEGLPLAFSTCFGC